MISMHIAPHAREKIEVDKIFSVGFKAREAVEAHGRDKVTDGSIGILLDDEGQLALLPAVDVATLRIKSSKYAPYAPIPGLPAYREDVIDYLFGHLNKAMPTECVATAGATGAIRLAVWNFLEAGDKLITHDYYWSPYRAIARDSLRELDVFPTYGEDRKFNVQGALDKVAECLVHQGRALLIINTPCNNPTGISLDTEEATRLRDGLVDLANQNEGMPITLLIDGAYWEFGDREENKRLMSLFADLPENLLFTFAFSLSKSMTRYGLRTGALAFMGKNGDALKYASGTIVSSIRSTWSNTTHLGQLIFSTIYRDPALMAQLVKEQDDFAELCNSRGHKFVKEAEAVGLPHTPYKGGFFVTLPTDNSDAVTERLMAKNIFLVPMKLGVRVAFCALASNKIPGLAAKIMADFN